MFYKDDGIFVLDFLNENLKNTLVDETTVTKDGIDFSHQKKNRTKPCHQRYFL